MTDLTGPPLDTPPLPSQPPHPPLLVREPADLLALVPRLLGFHPEESIVMVTFGGRGRNLHARVDLPPAPLLTPSVAPLVAAVQRHRVHRMALLIYSVDRERARAAWAHLEEVFAEREIVLALHRHQGWLSDLRDGHTEAVDLASHPITARSVFDGVSMLPSREHLVRSIAADPVACERVAAALPPYVERLATHPVGVEAAWVCRRVLAAASGRSALSDGEVARLAVGLTSEEVRMALTLRLRSQQAEAVSAVLGDVVRRCPLPLAAAPAALLALSAWLAGHGALAWCAVDRARASDPGCVLADLVAGVLEAAEPPSVWEGVIEGLLGSDPGLVARPEAGGALRRPRAAPGSG